MGDSNLLFESVFKRKLSATGTRDYLTQITTEYPYFSPAQFYLLLLTETGSPDCEKQAAKTSIMFNNAWWLQFQLQENRQGIAETGVTIYGADQQIILAESKESIVPHAIEPTESLINNEMVEFSQPEIAAIFSEQASIPIIEDNEFLAAENKIHPVDEEDWNTPPFVESNFSTPEIAFLPVENNLQPSIDENRTAHPFTESNISAVEIEFLPDEDTIDPVIEENWNAPPYTENNISPVEIEFLQVENSIFPEIEVPQDAPSFAESKFSTLETALETSIAPIDMEPVFNEAPVLNETAAPVAPGSVPVEIGDSNVAENEGEIIDNLHSGHFNTDSKPLVNEPETEEAPINEVEIAPLNFKLNINTAATTEDIISFEPLHTTDYFASLGIKLSSEIPPSDKLGKQLKSFTEWLKTMKKVHPDQLPTQSVASAISIQNLAEQSNKEGEVVTEAMADVLLQQGKADKAIEVFKKLSLLNPAKSAFFAAKIDQLKEH